MKPIFRRHKKCQGCGDFHNHWIPVEMGGKWTLRCILCAGKDHKIEGDLAYIFNDYFAFKYGRVLPHEA